MSQLKMTRLLRKLLALTVVDDLDHVFSRIDFIASAVAKGVSTNFKVASDFASANAVVNDRE
jgi:hypothetical protein